MIDIFPAAASSPTNEFNGSFAIPNASNTATVTGLGITDFVPTKVPAATVRMPSGGIVLFASVVDGTITADGFTFILSGLTDSASYILDFTMKP